MMRERIQSKVLSSVNQAQQNKVNILFVSCEDLEPEDDITIRVYPVRHWKMVSLASSFIPLVLSTVEYRRVEKIDMSDIIAQFNKTEKGKKKICHAKPLFELYKGEKYCWSVTIRSEFPWETVRPFNVAVKMKTELFAPKSRSRATVSIDTLTCPVTTSPGCSGITGYCDNRAWDRDRGCALFSCVGPGTCPWSREARVNKLMLLNFPSTLILDSDNSELNQQVFTKCNRIPQSELVQVSFSYICCTLSNQ